MMIMLCCRLGISRALCCDVWILRESMFVNFAGWCGMIRVFIIIVNSVHGG